ncbi:MerR family transcriptional regulator [archaeon]|jgi:effector-binding domain-containing protein|nr:MerR family transcriptional regulator [archaeon]MBT4647918.1 MerR family transcriptional regulator [archaeon]MBT7393152.1 MerR family transcriptional regulator [archaeon]
MKYKIPISTFSRLTQLTQKALRLYDKKEILTPKIKEITGYRYYTIDQIDVGIKIRLLVNLGFSLSDIHQILLSNDVSLIENLFEKQINKTNLLINELNIAKKILLKKNIEEVFTMKSEKPIIKKLPKIRVISKRVKGTYEESINQLTNELTFIIDKYNAKITGPVALLCYDDEYKEKNADIEVAIPISGSIEQGNYEPKKLPATKVVSLIHKGHPSEMTKLLKSYKKIFKFAEKNNLKLILPDRLLFIKTNPELKNEDFMFEIQYPIE